MTKRERVTENKREAIREGLHLYRELRTREQNRIQKRTTSFGGGWTTFAEGRILVVGAVGLAVLLLGGVYVLLGEVFVCCWVRFSYATG